MHEQQADDLIARGHLSSDWRPSFLAVPRRHFIPDTIWLPDRARPDLIALHRHEHPDRWRDIADGIDFVITQVDDGYPVGGDAGEAITSSASMPGVVALMLQHLDIRGGEHVLEIGTGTGWNAALLAHRLGADHVTSVEIDPDIATHARRALRDAGFGAVTVVTADGEGGYLPAAPYDRLIATAGATRLPYSWVAQTRPGGRILAPSWALDYHGLLLAFTVTDHGTAIGHAVDHVSFMYLRSQRPDPRHTVFASTDDEEQHATITDTDLHPAEVASGDYALGALITIGARVPQCQMDYFSSTDPGSHDGTVRLVDHHSRSWARLYYHHDNGASHPVHQYGPRKLWDEVHAAHTWWTEHDKPGPERWQFTITPHGQYIELLKP